jgi:hypothetical protein
MDTNTKIQILVDTMIQLTINFWPAIAFTAIYFTWEHFHYSHS